MIRAPEITIGSDGYARVPGMPLPIKWRKEVLANGDTRYEIVIKDGANERVVARYDYPPTT